MITVRDLAKKLREFANAKPQNGAMEVLLAYDGDVAFALGRADDMSSLSPHGTMERFLVLKPDIQGKKLELKGH